MLDFLYTLTTSYDNVIKIAIFNYFKTGNPLYDTVISTIFISVIGYTIHYVYENKLDKILIKVTFDDIKGFFYKKNTIILEGKRSTVMSSFCYNQNISTMYSNRFKAILDYIISNIYKIDTVFRIKEAHSTWQSSHEGDRRKNLDVFIVYQNKHFKIDDNIFVKIETLQDDFNDDREKINTKTDKITISIYSYIHSVNHLKKYIDNITYTYLSTIKENRDSKRFIYSLDKVQITNDETRLNCWREDIFESTRTFNNIFFDGKNELISKIDFFLKNGEWYYEKGIPYSLGIGLHGPPGTGKTSFIKALANYTKRHIVVMSLKTIKTKRQLEEFFFENRYNENNEMNSITFDKKIIVFEDIDCIGDIILDRSRQTINSDKKFIETIENLSENIKINDGNKIGNILQNICELNEIKAVNNSSSNEEPITLDDILNLWDGIRETPGRILIISSNHYHKLDPALIRPGRIDITHELSNASHNTISEIYYHLFRTKMDKNFLKKINEYFYSPAEIINIYVSNKNNTDFVKRLMKNEKI